MLKPFGWTEVLIAFVYGAIFGVVGGVLLNDKIEGREPREITIEVTIPGPVLPDDLGVPAPVVPSAGCSPMMEG